MVTVLVAVHDGEHYLEELLNSLINQTYKDIRIVVSDDKSSDGSRHIIEEFSKKYPNKIIPVFRAEPTGSAKAHFMKLTEEYKDSEFLMFCDQDDVWLPEKIEKTLSLMLKGDLAKPHLVHTDAFVVDKDLNITNKSFKAFSSLPETLSFNKLLAENIVQGASVMINSVLANAVLPDSDDIVIHDWWLAIVASSIGEIDYLAEPTFYYRQHGYNAIGASDKPKSLIYMIRRLKTDVASDINRSRRQAGLLYKRYGDKMRKDKADAAKFFAESETASKGKRLSVLRNQKIMPASFLKKVKFTLWG